MIKKIITISFAMLFLLIKKIFIRENRTEHKIMDNIANKLHSVFIYTSYTVLYLSLFDFKINSFDLNTIIYLLLFLQLVIIVRYFNKGMLDKKEFQTKLITRISKLHLIILILNWVFVSFGFAITFILVSVLNYAFYVFIIKQINKQKEQEEFKKQFGDGNYSKEDIVTTHINNLFEKNISINDLDKQQIKKQYRLMAKKYHPDVYKGDEIGKFESINSSYLFLLDLVK